MRSNFDRSGNLRGPARSIGLLNCIYRGSEKFDFGYNSDGQVRAIYAGGENMSFSYDGQGRLTNV
ncbi:MAG: RHS repeat protein [Candidatus Eremiobacteraeota bacterium]|nr:RHS repeat protein [Candidatus Eremiobacteraeota bacterium]MCW5870895.1 RHS repeat protein [Candidatus Eremiobacteraeota bacterium]